MTNEHRPVPSIVPAADPSLSKLEIATSCYEERRVIFPAITEALELCGCWLLDRRSLSLIQVEFSFELPLRSIIDLYAVLIATGLELTRSSHEHLTTLCTLNKHRGHLNSLPGVVTVRLEVNFIEDLACFTPPGTAHA